MSEPPPHGEAIATARAFQERAQALRVVLILDLGDGDAVMIDVDETDDIEVTEGDRVRTVERTRELPAARPLPEIRPAPASAIRFDVDTGELAAPLGTVDHLAASVKALAEAFGGLSVASAEFATSDPDLPITLAAREGERVVLAAGDEQFEL